MRLRNPRVFISSAREDEHYAVGLSEQLARRGASVWTPQELNLAAPTFPALREAMKRSDVFLVLVTRESIGSTWVRDELRMALGVRESWERAKVVAIRLDDAPLPTDIAALPVIEASASDWTHVAEILLDTHPSFGQIATADFEEEVVEQLEALGVKWEQEPVINGLRPDFLVEFPNGRRAVIEVKGHDSPSLVEATQTRTQVARLGEATDADAALAVYRTIDEAIAGQGVVNPWGLGEALRRLAEAAPRALRPSPDMVETSSSGRTVFAVMPFSPDYGDVFWVAMREAAAAVGAACVRVDEVDYEGDVVEKIKAMITASEAVIADLSEARPNVLYEVGYAHALNRPSIHVCSTPLDELPMDVRNWNTIEYRKGETHLLRGRLEKRLKAILWPES